MFYVSRKMQGQTFHQTFHFWGGERFDSKNAIAEIRQKMKTFHQPFTPLRVKGLIAVNTIYIKREG